MINRSPGEPIGQILRQQLVAAALAGGTVTLPPGRVWLDAPLVVPPSSRTAALVIQGSGTELRLRRPGIAALQLGDPLYLDAASFPSGLASRRTGTTTAVSGTSFGSTSIIVASATGISAGTYLVLEDGSTMTPTFGGAALSGRGQLVQVAAGYVSGTTIPLVQPVGHDYSGTVTVHILRADAMVRSVTVSDVACVSESDSASIAALFAGLCDQLTLTDVRVESYGATTFRAGQLACCSNVTMTRPRSAGDRYGWTIDKCADVVCSHYMGNQAVGGNHAIDEAFGSTRVDINDPTFAPGYYIPGSAGHGQGCRRVIVRRPVMQSALHWASSGNNTQLLPEPGIEWVGTGGGVRSYVGTVLQIAASCQSPAARWIETGVISIGYVGGGGGSPAEGIVSGLVIEDSVADNIHCAGQPNAGQAPLWIEETGTSKLGNVTVRRTTFRQRGGSRVVSWTRLDNAVPIAIAFEDCTFRADGAPDSCVMLGGGASFSGANVTFLRCEFTGGAHAVRLGSNFTGSVAFTTCTRNGGALNGSHVNNASVVTPGIS